MISKLNRKTRTSKQKSLLAKKAGSKKSSEPRDKVNLRTVYSSPQKDNIEDIENKKQQQALFKHGALRITDRTNVEIPTPIIKIGGEIISTAGNITTISGPSKSGKSAFTSPIISAAISKDGIIADEFEELYVLPNESGKAVIHIDTEQATHKHKANIISACKRAGHENCPQYFFSYNFRSVELEKFKVATEEIFKIAFKECNGIHLVVIDGIGDYLESVNNPTQSNDTVKLFEQLAIKFKTAILVIVHTNPGNDKERGHLGSQLQRKSESVLTIRTEPKFSYVEPKLLRMADKADVPHIMFRYDAEKGYHVSCGILNKEENMIDERKAQLLQIAENVFPPSTNFKNRDAIQRIISETGKQIATAKKIFVEMKELKLVKQNADKNWCLNQDENEGLDDTDE